MSIRKAVITAAGLGTRLLPMTKELPKEMLPIYMKGSNEDIILKPLLQALFEQLHSFGIRNFCFVVGRGKRAIEDHFTPEKDYMNYLKEIGKTDFASELRFFYQRVESSSILWVNQPEPKGFGDALQTARSFIGDESFMVCAGDTYIMSDQLKFLRKMVDFHFENGADATLLLQAVPDPSEYGVAVIQNLETGKGKVLNVVEKPIIARSNLAIMPYYIFSPKIFDSLRDIKPGVGNEIQLTDAIQNLVDRKLEVRAVLLDKDELRLDIGTPTNYWDAIRTSFQLLADARARDKANQSRNPEDSVLRQE